MDYFERLISWNIPRFAQNEASEALADCVKRLNRRRLEAEQQAMTAQIAGLQDELGAAAITTAFAEGTVADVSLELQETLQHGEEIGNEIHKRQRKDGRETVQVAIDG
jgi:hypothetical protein